jgi:hypothetical protein
VPAPADHGDVQRVVAVVVGAVLVLATAITAAAGFSYDARQHEAAGNDVRRAALRSLSEELGAGLRLTAADADGRPVPRPAGPPTTSSAC